MKTLGFLFFLLTSLLISLGAEAAHLRALKANNDGVRLLMEENNTQAYRLFVEGLSYDPFEPRLHMNLGLVFLLNEEKEKSYQAFVQAEQLASEKKDILFMARFNAGVVASSQGQIDLALEHYQKALEIHPDSVEVKTNIELLWQAQGGNGEGDGQESQDGKDQREGGGEGDQENEDQPQEPDDKQEWVNRRDQQRPFESEQLTPQDVQRILEEIKNQEQKVRAKEFSQDSKEAPNDKDW